MPTARRKTGEVRITGLDPEEENVIKAVVGISGGTIRSWALRHAAEDAQEYGIPMPVSLQAMLDVE